MSRDASGTELSRALPASSAGDGRTSGHVKPPQETAKSPDEGSHLDLWLRTVATVMRLELG
jgi:hypothetical protein